MANINQGVTNQTDRVLELLAEYAVNKEISSEEALETAKYALMDSLGCGVLALRYPECTKLLGPVVPGAETCNGCRVPGTMYELDPVQGAFNIGSMIRWLDYNDTWLAAEWGHPSDNLGAILAVADYVSRDNLARNRAPLTVKDVLLAMIKAYEIQGVLALENSFNRQGLDHILLVKIASTAVATVMLGGNKEEVINAISNAWIDNSSLRTYRHFPNTGSRKSWAAGDATSKAVKLALFALKGEMGYKTALTAPQWGFQDVLMDGKEIVINRPLDAYVMENILFKISYPAEFHAQTAAECAIELHDEVKERIEDIQEIILTTHESAIRIIDKKGPLYNPADRDHCLQYIVAIGLLFGYIEADHYEDEAAADPRIDVLREKMTVVENESFTEEYSDPEKRSIANAVQVVFKDGSKTGVVEQKYPVGHRFRREEGIPLLLKKYRDNLQTRFPSKQVELISAHFDNQEKLLQTPVNELMEMLII